MRVRDETTGDLSCELMNAASMDSNISDNSSFFVDQSVAGLLTALYKKKSVSKAALARKACMGEADLHQAFSAGRKPSRDRLLCICIGLGAALEETQEPLRQAACAQLYPRIKRDAIIVRRTELNKINDKLLDENGETLF